ncbi:leucine carboxyl methyltransferase [Chloropicon primus]|uniref:Leucine carboxyl methyltransferase 1 homolog n=1 Tax=Chloropicon primus TaxID=1764295 RepID=A0A5B8MP33_9CHLO|nr:leucine carboxyl methyltransferase [Chloropicon primus]UPR01467.1 leucine carboxyl methyltransferase [Chloropicon primus]|mmetsp:Transcript_10896/g.30648  ORF Transcript_10896/g.30648 Transcript_10896/m.30648 type:complete len:341 (+) Transcript_10896:211-1233(+)|eukprot:QDZ22249.1 leucine carboxyl methyltransferase [Chloropicon primus]
MAAFRVPDARRSVPGGNADRCVQGTNDDATVSKLSCATLGYFQDDFVHLFVRRRTRRPPMINRGYFARVQAIRQAIQGFMEAAGGGSGGAQIVSLGSGWDTNFFRLREAKAEPKLYIELDHKEVTCSKCRSVKKSPALCGLLAGEDQSGEAKVDVESGTISSAKYALLPSDLRDPAKVKASLDVAQADYEAPTFILLECVLAYLDGDATRNLLSLLANTFERCCVLIYDMIGPDDPFGQQLIYNVESRGCPLPGIRSFPAKESHAKLLEECGFTCGGVHDMLEVYGKYVNQDERKRTERIEFLDELEEWHLIMAHYCLSYGFKGSPDLFGTRAMPLKLQT